MWQTYQPGNRPGEGPAPHARAEKYDNPIPSREYIMAQLAEFGAPLGRDKLAAMLDLHEEEDLEALRRRLNAMERDGQLIRNRRDGFCLVNKKDLIAGRVIGHKDGFGFLKPDEGGEDLFLTPRQMRSLLHGDRAVVRVVGIDQRGRREGALVEVLEHVNREIVGRIYIESGLGFVVPDDKRINQDLVVRQQDLNGAGHGQIVVAEILEQPSKRSQPIGRVVEILGEHMAPGMETDVAIRAFGLPSAWPAEVTAEISGLGESVDERQTAGRVDLRKRCLVTIDGADARDFDDAVYCEATPRGGNCWSASPTFPVTSGPAVRSTMRRDCAAHRSTFRTGSFRCCRRCCRTGSVRSTPTWIASAWCASCTSMGRENHTLEILPSRYALSRQTDLRSGGCDAARR